MALSQAERIVTRRVGRPDSWTLQSYLADGGYEGLRKALTMAPDDITQEVLTSNILGRGGAGFAAGKKWSMLRKAEPVYLVVNGDESEPATFKDHMLIESDPHQLIEGALICAYAIGAAQAFIYIRGEFALGLERMQAAVNEAYAHGAVGNDIFGSGFSVDVVVHPGAGAYICGEETALLESLEGKRGFPRIKPPVLPGRHRPVRRPHHRQQRRDAVEPPVDRAPTAAPPSPPWAAAAPPAPASSRCRATSTAPATTRSRWSRRRSATSSTATTTAAASATASSSRRSSPAGRRRRGSAPSSSTSRWARTRWPRPRACCRAAAARCSAPARSSSWTRRRAWCGPPGAWPGSSPASPAASARRAGRARGWLDKIMRRIEDGVGRMEDIDLLVDVSDNIAPGLSFPYPMTTICFLGPSSPMPIVSAIQMFRDEFVQHIEQGRCPLD